MSAETEAGRKLLQSLGEMAERQAAGITVVNAIVAIEAEDDPVLCAICGDYSAQGVEVHEWCIHHPIPPSGSMNAAPMTLGLEAPPRYGITRQWAMPTGDTFDAPPIADFLRRWHRPPSVDPFARNSEWATYRNDLSPATTAEYHMEAADFCELLRVENVRAECVLFDPPYSPGQIVELYQSVGLPTAGSGQNGRLYREVRDSLDELLVSGGVALSFGWNSAGFGRERGYQVVEILLVAHGGAHNDTICMAEVKL